MTGNWLILETSGPVGQVGLARGGAVIRVTQLDPARRHARDLAPTVAAVLTAEGLRPTDLEGVMVGRGPGSYTGLRVGLISAKTLAYATGCALIPVDTFAAVAAQAPAAADTLWVIADALRDQVYRQRFVRRQGRLVADDELRIEPFTAWAAGAEGWVSGPGLAIYGHRLPPRCRPVPPQEREPRAEGVFAAGRYLSPVSREELFALEPLYLRASSAEEKARSG